MRYAVQLGIAALLAGVAAVAGAQTWSPSKNVEIVVPNPPGGSNDKTARSLERITSAQRFPGAFAEISTWKEQGADFTFGAWRAIFAPEGLTPQQLAYWEGVLRKSTEAPEWKDELAKNIWSNVFTPSAQFSKDLEQDYASMKAVLVDPGLAK